MLLFVVLCDGSVREGALVPTFRGKNGSLMRRVRQSVVTI